MNAQCIFLDRRLENELKNIIAPNFNILFTLMLAIFRKFKLNKKRKSSLVSTNLNNYNKNTWCLCVSTVLARIIELSNKSPTVFTHFMLLVSFYTPKNIRKPNVFQCFQGVQKEKSGMKCVNKSRILQLIFHKRSLIK